MLTNAQMKAGRFLRWHKARKSEAWIKARLAEGCTVMISSYTKATKLTAKHAWAISSDRVGVYLQSGKRFNDISGCSIKAYA